MWVLYVALCFGVYLPVIVTDPTSPLLKPMCLTLSGVGLVVLRATYVVHKRWEAGLIRCMECDVPLSAVRELETKKHSFGRCPQCKRGYKLEKRT